MDKLGIFLLPGFIFYTLIPKDKLNLKSPTAWHLILSCSISSLFLNLFSASFFVLIIYISPLLEPPHYLSDSVYSSQLYSFFSFHLAEIYGLLIKNFTVFGTTVNSPILFISLFLAITWSLILQFGNEYFIIKYFFPEILKAFVEKDKKGLDTTLLPVDQLDIFCGNFVSYIQQFYSMLVFHLPKLVFLNDRSIELSQLEDFLIFQKTVMFTLKNKKIYICQLKDFDNPLFESEKEAIQVTPIYSGHRDFNGIVTLTNQYPIEDYPDNFLSIRKIEIHSFTEFNENLAQYFIEKKKLIIQF